MAGDEPAQVEGKVALARQAPGLGVQMGDFELSACGGTHLRSTAEALPVKLLRLERVKGGLARVHFRAGWEALEDFEQKHDLVTALALGLNPRTFAVAVTYAASCSFLTPLEPACVLIYTPGGYRFLDFVKIGSILTIVVFIAVMLLVPVIWKM